MIVYVALPTLEVVIIVIIVVSVTHIQDRVLADDFFPLIIIFVFLIILDHLVMPLYPL
jgi:flagellar biosynthesis protein FliQ